ncbi:MAG: ATP-dependent metallopeptidase FtsH/Yme1/Tma family protein [Clostridia bacterium]|nr:ATP-dependent metallopeptidase FtsH/Yme1/Tma family protein [Clostridia bacterium]
MKKRKRIIIVLIIIIAVISVVIGISLFNAKNKVNTSYKDFIGLVDSNSISKVIIGDEKIIYNKKDDDTTYITDNPKTEDFKEYLLLKDIKVESESNPLIILDILFYGIFFGSVGYGIYRLLKFKITTFKVIRHNETRFSDIAGLDELKEDIIKTVDILKNPKEYQKIGIKAPTGIMLEGPPGNGKTLFARALAGEGNINFIAAKATDFQSAMMSVGPAKVKMLFKKARRNAPCIIFIDEFDGIGEKRNYAGSGIDKENNRMITALLNEMDGFDQSNGVLVIAATNSYKSLDPALIRAGRFDKKYVVPNPDSRTRELLIDLYTKNKSLDGSINKEKIISQFSGRCSSEIEAILNEAATIANIRNHEKITQSDLSDAIRKINN